MNKQISRSAIIPYCFVFIFYTPFLFTLKISSHFCHYTLGRLLSVKTATGLLKLLMSVLGEWATQLQGCRVCVITKHTLKNTSSPSTCVLLSTLCSLLIRMSSVFSSNNHGHTLSEGSTFRDYSSVLSVECVEVWRLDEHHTPWPRFIEDISHCFCTDSAQFDGSKTFTVPTLSKVTLSSHTVTVKLWHQPLDHRSRTQTKTEAEPPTANTHRACSIVHCQTWIQSVIMQFNKQIPF